MLQDQSRNRTPMPGAQAPAAAPPDTGPARAEAGIAALLAAPTDIDAQAGEAQEVDWHNPPPGFMAFPAIEPSGFIRVERGLLLEVERLLRIAMAEFYRKTERAVPGEADEDRRQREADLRERLYIPPLVAAFDPDSDGAKALAALNGGRAPGQPADTAPTGDAVDLAIEAHRAARAALTAACNPADSVWVEQNGGDASDEAMAPAREARNAASEAALRPSRTSPALVMLIEEWHALGQRLEEPDFEDGPEWDASSERHNAMEMAIYDFPAASMADLLAKVPVFRNELYDATSGLSEEYAPSETLAGAAWLGLFRDFERLAAAPAASPSLVDQIIAGWREWASRCGLDETDADRAAWERVTEQRDALLDAAEALPPTLESLPAKALAFAWLEYVQIWEMGLARAGYDITGGLAVDIDTAIVGHFRMTDI